MQCVLRKSVRPHGAYPTISRKRARTLGRLLVCFLVLSLAGNHLVPGQNKLPAVADFIDIAQRAGLTSANVFGGKESSRYILESTGTARRSHSEHHSRRSKAPGRLPRHFFGGN